MEDFFILKVRRVNKLREAEELEIQMSERINQILKVFKSIDFGYEGQPYDSNSPIQVLFGNHLIPSYFDYFDFDSDSQLYVGGEYHGTRGYYEHEYIRFPPTWVDLPEDILRREMLRFWDNHLQNEKIKKADLERKKAEKEKAEYERLKEKFGDA